MPAAARRSAPDAAPAPVPQRRPRHLRESDGFVGGDGAEPTAVDGAAPPAGSASGPAAGPGEVRRLQDRVARAFTAPAGAALEVTLMRLIILAAACLFLRTAIIGGGGFVTGLLLQR